MSLCINPNCAQPDHPGNDMNRFCQSCGSDLILQGRYRVMRMLSDSSGFGSVYEAYERSMPKLLKVLKPRHNANAKAVELFEQEAAVLSRLHHPGIPQVDEDGCFQFLPRDGSEPLHCIIMEKIDGPNLSEWMRQQGGHPISERQALNWLRQLAQVLHLIHQQNYFHRDIKPENIMLRSNGQVVLVDFGAAREMTYTYFAQLGGTGGITRISSAGYTPPEQERGQAVPQSDFYALGCTFIFLLTGRTPAEPAIYDSLNNEFHWRHLAPQVSSPLADFIDRLTASRAADRPGSTQVLLDDLEAIAEAIEAASAIPTPVGGVSLGAGSALPPMAGPNTRPQHLTAAAPAGGTKMQPLSTFLQTSRGSGSRWIWLLGPALVAIALGGLAIWYRTQLSPAADSGSGASVQQANTATTLAPLQGHTSAANALALSRDQLVLVSGSDDRTARIWSMIDRSMIHTLSGHDNPINAVAISPNGQFLATAGDDLYIQIWHLNDGVPVRRLVGHEKPINDLIFTSDSSTLLSASADETIRAWDAETGEETQKFIGHEGFVNAIALTPDGKTLVSGAADNTIKVWDMETGDLNDELLGHTSFINDLAISPDGRWLASAGADGLLKLWNLGTATEIRSLDEHESYVNALLFSPDGRTLVSSSADQTIRLWNVSTGELQETIDWPGTFIDAIAIKFEGPTWQLMAGGKGSSDIQVWQLTR